MITMSSVTVNEKTYKFVAHEPELSDWRNLHDMTVHVTTPVPMTADLIDVLNKISREVREALSPEHTKFIEVLFSF